MPETVNAIMLDNTKKAIPVEWHNVDKEAMKAGGVAKYDILGTADGMTAHCYVSMVEYNYLENWSFEDGETGWTATALKSFDELHVEDKATDSQTGTKHYHFWGAGANSVVFTLEQTKTDLPTGRYNYSISIMGGDGGKTDIYAYVKKNGETVATAPLVMTVYNEWHTATVEGIEYQEGETLTVGIYVSCEGAGAGAWGKIDDAL